jgi:hypothetical protein
MSTTLFDGGTAVDEAGHKPEPSPYLSRVLDEIEREPANRVEATQHPAPAPERAQRPYGSD